jgi:hypothetical protein
VNGDVAPVVLPVSWRSYLKAAFFSGMLTTFGVGAVTFGTAVAWLGGGAMTLVGVVPFVDLFAATRRWQLVGDELQIPRIWAPSRSLDAARDWSPGIDSVGRRDSIFQVQTTTGKELVHPNLLVARSDVRQWLHLIGERQRSSA